MACERLGLGVVGAVIDEEPGLAADPAGPQVALPAADPDEGEAVKDRASVMPAFDMPEEDGLAKAVVRRLGEGARGQATAQLQLSNQSPAMRQFGVSGMGASRTVAVL